MSVNLFVKPWKRIKLHLIAVSIFCLSSGFAYWLVDSGSIVPREDALDYDTIGWNMAQGKGFSLDGNVPTAIRGPIYPSFLAIIYLAIGHSYTAIRVVQILLHVANCLLVFSVAKEVYNENVGVVATTLYAIYPAFIFYTGLILSETLTILLLLCSILLLVKALYYQSLILTGVSGIVLGLCTLCKPTTFLYPIFLSLLLILCKKTRHHSIYGFTLTTVMILTITPWTIRNYVNFGKFIPVSVFSGYNLLLGTIPPNDLTFDHNLFVRDYWTDPVEKDSEAFRQGLQNIMTNPLGYILMMPKKLIYFLLPDGMSIIGKSSTPQGISLIVFQLILLIFALVGYFHELVSEKSLVLISLIIYFGIVHIIIISTPRFNLPIIPYVLILASIGLKIIFFRNQCLKRKKPSEVGSESSHSLF